MAFAPLPVAADVSIGVTPSLVEMTAKPGATGGQDLKISNQGSEGFDATTGLIEMRGSTAANSAVSWLTVEPPSFHIEPKKTQTVKVSVTVPDGLASGGYYALVTITTGEKEAAGNQAGISGQLGIPFLITVSGSGKVQTTAAIEKFAPVLGADGRIGF